MWACHLKKDTPTIGSLGDFRINSGGSPERTRHNSSCLQVDFRILGGVASLSLLSEIYANSTHCLLSPLFITIHLPCNQTLSQSFRRIECTTKTVVAAEQFRQFALIFAIILFPLQRRDDIQISHVHYVGQFFVTATISRLSSSINFLCRFAQSATKKCCFLLQFNASCTHFLDSKCRNFSEMLAF